MRKGLGRTAILALAGMALAVGIASAGPITPGFTFAVASSSNHVLGTHYHSNTGGAFGNPAGKAEVGAFSSEEVRGLSEYNLAGLATGPAFVTFNVFKAGGLFSGVNDFPFTGTIGVYAYQGNNLEDISDYQAASVGSIGSFSTAGLAVGNTLSFDISTVYANALANSWTSLGIRLERIDIDPPTLSGAWTFDTFRLTSTDDTNTVPDPGSSLLLLGIGLVGLKAWRKRLG